VRLREDHLRRCTPRSPPRERAGVRRRRRMSAHAGAWMQARLAAGTMARQRPAVPAQRFDSRTERALVSGCPQVVAPRPHDSMAQCCATFDQVRGGCALGRVARCAGRPSRTGVPRRADLGLWQALLVALAVAKVRDLHQRLRGGVQQRVLQLDIPVDHALVRTTLYTHAMPGTNAATCLGTRGVESSCKEDQQRRMQPYAHHLVAVVQANNQLLEEPSRVVLLQSRATAVSRKGVRTYGMDAPTYISSMLKPQAVLLIPPHHMLSTTYTASG